MNKIERFLWIDQARGILFLFVIVCHAKTAPDWLKNIYEPLFLTGFFFLSGYLYKNKDVIEKLKSVFNGLFFPFILYCIISGILSFMQTYSISNCLSVIWNNLLGGDMVWFIPCLITVELTYILIQILIKRWSNYLIICISLLSFWATTTLGQSRGIWCWETSLAGLGFFAFGNISKQFIPLTKEGIKYKYTVLIIFSLYIVTCLIAGHLNLLNNIDMHLNHYGNRIIFLICATLGCFSYFKLCVLIPNFPLLTEFGKYTLLLFPFHGAILRNVNKVMCHVNIHSTLLQLVILVIITSLICLFLGRLTYKYLPILSGKVRLLK